MDTSVRPHGQNPQQQQQQQQREQSTSTFDSWYRDIPIVTRIYVTAVLLTTIACVPSLSLAISSGIDIDDTI